MDDQLGVGVRDGVGYGQEQAQAGSEGQRPGPAIAIDGFSLDVLEDQIR